MKYICFNTGSLQTISSQFHIDSQRFIRLCVIVLKNSVTLILLMGISFSAASSIKYVCLPFLTAKAANYDFISLSFENEHFTLAIVTEIVTYILINLNKFGKARFKLFSFIRLHFIIVYRSVLGLGYAE